MGCRPDGQIDFDFDRRCARRSLSTRENRVRQKANFASRFNAILPVQSCREKYSDFVFSEINVNCSRPALDQEGRFAIVTNVERGMRWTHMAERNPCGRTVFVRTAKSCGPGAPTQALRS